MSSAEVEEIVPDQVLTDLQQLMRLLRRTAVYIAAMAVAFGFATYFCSYLFTPVYRAEVLAIPNADRESSSILGGLLNRFGGGLGGMIGLDGASGTQSTAALLATFRSRVFLELFLAEQHLLPVLFDERWDSAAGAWRSDKREPSLEDGYYVFTRKVMTVTEDRKTSLVTVRVEWRDPQLAAQWANLLVARLNRFSRERAIKESSDSIAYLEQELASADKVVLGQSISSLIESQVNKRMLATTRPEFALKTIDPAQPPSLDRYVKPNRMLFLATGLFFGALAGFGFGLMRTRRRTGAG